MSRRPNILIVMVDQLNGTLFPDGPADFLHAPHLKALAARSARFANNYTASPLCAPGRAAFMSGQLPSRTRVYDNAAEFASDIPTYAHHLRAAGYYTCLSGKMHFVGPDQLHGFEERLTTDIYPADFGWTPDYRKPGERIDWWYHNLGSVTGAGVAEITNQMEYDDEVAFFADAEALRAGARSPTTADAPAVVPDRLLQPSARPLRRAPAILGSLRELPGARSARRASSRSSSRIRIRSGSIAASDYASFDITPRHGPPLAARLFRQHLLSRRQGRRTDLDVLERTRMLDDTVILFCSDHGDMLGERGLWFKMCFFEGSARVPLMIAGKGVDAGPDRRAGLQSRHRCRRSANSPAST